MRWLAQFVLFALLTACSISPIEAPQPTQSVLPTPGLMVAQAYLPLILNRYPRVTRGYAGYSYNLTRQPYYHWTITPTQMDPQFSRMVWCVTDYHLNLYEPQIVLAATSDHQAGISRTWFLLNEPDDSGNGVFDGQCGVYKLTGNPFDPSNAAQTIYQNPAETARRVAKVYDLIKAYDQDAQIFIGGLGWPGHQISQNWWKRFVGEFMHNDELEKLEFIHFHAYPYGSFQEHGMLAFREGVRAWVKFNGSLGAPTIEYWITEVGGGSCSRWERWNTSAYTTIRGETMLPIQKWMDSEALVLNITRVYWFVSWDGPQASWWCNYLIDNRTQTTLTALGDVWK